MKAVGRWVIAVSTFTLCVSCAEGPSSSNGEGAGDFGPAAGDFDASKQPCDGVRVPSMSGQVLDVFGDPPTTKVFTLCGNACLRGDLNADGTFLLENNFCFAEIPPLTRPIFIFHGIGQYTDLYYDFVPPGETVVEASFPEPLYVVPLTAMASVQVTPAYAQSLTDGNGFELTFDAGAASLPLGRDSIAVWRLAPEHFPPVVGAETLTALYATAPDETIFDPPAQLRFPNTTNLSPGTVVEIMAIGNVSMDGVYAGTLGRVDTGHVDMDGTTISSDNGVEVLGWLGYRPL